MPVWTISNFAKVTEIDDRLAIVIILDEREAWKVNLATWSIANTTCLAPGNVPGDTRNQPMLGFVDPRVPWGKSKEAGLGVSLTSI